MIMEILNFKETKDLFLKYNIPCCETEIFNVKEKALGYAEKIGFPVVLKIHSGTIFHKTEAGGVKVGIKNSEEFIEAWDEIARNIEGRSIEGILVQEMVSGKEIAMGMKNDEQFGPVLMFGLGGIFIEVLNDVSLRVAPVSKQEAVEMVNEIKGLKILEGYRGGEVVDISKIANILVSLSKMSIKESYIKGIDLNPIVATNKYVKLVDFRIII